MVEKLLGQLDLNAVVDSDRHHVAKVGASYKHQSETRGEGKSILGNTDHGPVRELAVPAACSLARRDPKHCASRSACRETSVAGFPRRR